jgi:uncharacterized membrane protein YoaK (UPF0700 family)
MKPASCATGVLVLTAFAAGLVDVLSFAKLGGVFTSAMTGNLALLGFYASTGAVRSAIKSTIALAGFIVGCAIGTIQGRRQTNRSAARRILALETLIIAACAIGSAQLSLSARADLLQVEILLLAFAMGLQSIVGARLGQTNVVFTMTLVKIVSALIGSARAESTAGERLRDAAIVIAYLAGALIAGLAIATHFAPALFVPVVAIGIAFLIARGVE